MRCYVRPRCALGASMPPSALLRRPCFRFILHPSSFILGISCAPSMTSAQFDFTPLFPAGLPAAAARWTGRVKHDVTGGSNDADALRLDGLIAAATAVMKREGRTLATYGLNSGPQGYRPLREFLVGKLKADAGIACST